jgi:hypothetical protein
MDALLAQASHQFTTFAIRSGISIAGGYAIKQVSTYISKQPLDSHKRELEVLSKRLDQKIKIVTPAIDLIEIIAARGNTTLNSTVQLTVSLRNDINDFGQRMSETMETLSKADGAKGQSKAIIQDMKMLLARIEDAVPLISLALTTSGANLSAALPETVSPSRLLQASSFLQTGDMQFNSSKSETQIGPSFSLKLYTIFEGHSRRDPNISDITWQETYAKAIFEVIRMPMTADVAHNEGRPLEHPLEYLYHFRVTEDLNDGRYHEEIETGSHKRDAQGFIRGASRDIPVHSIARLFFSASGRLLNIEEARTPVLVLKVNHALPGPSALIRAIFANQYGEDKTQEYEHSGYTQESAASAAAVFGEDDLEWVALEMWSNEDDEDESESESEDALSDEHENEAADENDPARPDTADTEELDSLAMQMQVLNMSAKSQQVSPSFGQARADVATLSLLEYILRLAALQTSEQTALLSISDERISLFLRDDARRTKSSRRSSHRQNGEPRARGDRHETPASVASYDEFIPGTQRRPRYRSTTESSGGYTRQSSTSQVADMRAREQQTPVARTRARASQTPAAHLNAKQLHADQGDLNSDAGQTAEASGKSITDPRILLGKTFEATIRDTSPLARHADGTPEVLPTRSTRWPRAFLRLSWGSPAERKEDESGEGEEVEADNPFK